MIHHTSRKLNHHKRFSFFSESLNFLINGNVWALLVIKKVYIVDIFVNQVLRWSGLGVHPVYTFYNQSKASVSGAAPIQHGGKMARNLIDCLVFYAILSIFQPYNGGLEIFQMILKNIAN